MTYTSLKWEDKTQERNCASCRWRGTRQGSTPLFDTMRTALRRCGNAANASGTAAHPRHGHTAHCRHSRQLHPTSPGRDTRQTPEGVTDRTIERASAAPITFDELSPGSTNLSSASGNPQLTGHDPMLIAHEPMALARPVQCIGARHGRFSAAMRSTHSSKTAALKEAVRSSSLEHAGVRAAEAALAIEVVCLDALRCPLDGARAPHSRQAAFA